MPDVRRVHLPGEADVTDPDVERPDPRGDTCTYCGDEDIGGPCPLCGEDRSPDAAEPWHDEREPWKQEDA